MAVRTSATPASRGSTLLLKLRLESRRNLSPRFTRRSLQRAEKMFHLHFQPFELVLRQRDEIRLEIIAINRQRSAEQRRSKAFVRFRLQLVKLLRHQRRPIDAETKARKSLSLVPANDRFTHDGRNGPQHVTKQFNDLEPRENSLSDRSLSNFI